ncbi:hydrogenase 4 subunit B, partial [Candidatus Microgenomates bacterium]|nr:hydrogenase 4 subunit B [Candidatus Microgenomates bacterium]
MLFYNWWGGCFAILGALTGILTAVTIILSKTVISLTLQTTLPLLSVYVRIDQLSAFFIFIISLIALASSIYGLGYVKHYYKKYNLGALGFFYNLFLAGMVLVVSSSQVVFFLIVWEIMSLASYFLVIFEHKENATLKAGSLYFVMTHVGTVFIIIALMLLYITTGSLDFQAIKANITMVPPVLKTVVFLLALIGFGTKAGIIPFHIWLLSAHPAAPSHVSALMSGVMIKTGVYMLIRLTIDLMAPSPIWWGVIVLILGAISSLLGVLYALTEHDLKRLLAYHSIENIGIILLGVGSSLIFGALNLGSLAVLALTAALFHTLNHAIFKAVLFLGAGAVISQTHTRNIEDYGGLIKLMPITAFLFLIGSLAISALPPFNGFFSEWVTFQAIFAGISGSAIALRWVFIVGAGSLAFTGGLAAMCFVKAFGATFLARPRSEEVKRAKEVDNFLLAGMSLLAAAIFSWLTKKDLRTIRIIAITSALGQLTLVLLSV